MALVPLENVGSMGVILDRKPYELPPEAWSLVKNVRLKDNVLIKFPGHEEVYATPSTPPRWILPWPGATDYYWVYAGTDKIYRVTGSTHTNITRYTTTPGDDDYGHTTADRWSGGLLGGVPILVSSGRVDDPQQWNGTSGRLEDLGNWPATYKCAVIRVHKQFLIALRVIKGGNTFEHLVKWSHPATPGTVPTSWDETDDANDSGEIELAETGGFLVDCATLGAINILYKEGSTWTMQYVGGQSIFDIQPLFSSSGLLAIDCGKEFNGMHFAVGRDDIVVHDGTKNSIQSVIKGRNLEWYRENLSADNYQATYVARNYKESEMWVCMVTEGGASGVDAFTTADTAMIWNWKDNTWTFRDLPGCAHAAYGVVDDTTTFRIINSQTQIIDEDPSLIDSRSYSPAKEDLVLAGTVDTKLYKADTGEDFAGTDIEFYAVRTGLAIVGKDRQGNLKIDLNSTKFVRRIYPKIEAPCDVNISVGGQDREDGAVDWQGPFAFCPRTDTFIDVLVNARFIALRIELDGAVSCKVRGFLLDMDVIGEATM